MSDSAISARPITLTTRLATALARRGCDIAYGVTGAAIGRFTGAAAAAGLRIVHPRHESGAGFMATEHSLVSGRPAVVFVTSGPGLSNALTGLFAAAWEGAHVVAVVGATPVSRAARFPFQRTGPEQLRLRPWLPEDVAHTVTVVDGPGALSLGLSSLDAALSCEAGSLTVFLLPTDAQQLPCAAPAQPVSVPPPDIRPRDLDAVQSRLDGRRVVCWIGHHARSEPRAVRALVDVLDAAVVVTPRGKGVFAETDPRCLGVLGLGGARGVASRVRAVDPDVALVLGARLSEFTSWWDARLVPRHGFVHVGPTEPGSAFSGANHTRVLASVGPFVRALTTVVRGSDGARPSTELPSELPPEHFEAGDDGLHPGQVMQVLQEHVVPRRWPVISEAGNAFAWATRVLRFDQPDYRVSPDFGAMGQASAGVVGLALGRNGPAVAVLGDGAMLMNTELSTAVAENARAIWVVLNDAAYGMIAHGMQAIGLPPVATAIPRVDFVAFARAQGADGASADSVEELEVALRAAADASGPFVIDVRIDPRFPPPFGARNDALNDPSDPQETRWRG